MENDMYKKIHEESEREYNKYIKLFTYNYELGYKDDLNKYYKFMFNDILLNSQTSNNLSNNDSQNYLHHLENPTELYEKYFEKKVKYNNQNNYFKIEIRKAIIAKNNNIRKKIAECNSHLDIIKKNYIHLLLSNTITSNTQNQDLRFPDKSVLSFTSTNNTSNDAYNLGEIFSRYLFTIAASEKPSNNSENTQNYNSSFNNTTTLDKSKQENFYNDDNVFSYYISPDTGINDDFNKWSFFDKNFLIYIYLIGILFTKNGDFTFFFKD